MNLCTKFWYYFVSRAQNPDIKLIRKAWTVRKLRDKGENVSRMPRPLEEVPSFFLWDSKNKTTSKNWNPPPLFKQLFDKLSLYVLPGLPELSHEVVETDWSSGPTPLPEQPASNIWRKEKETHQRQCSKVRVDNIQHIWSIGQKLDADRKTLRTGRICDCSWIRHKT